MWSRASARRNHFCLCATVPCEGNLLNSNYSTLHSKRLMRRPPTIPRGRLLQPLTSLPVFPYEQPSLSRGTLRHSDLSFLRKYRKKTVCGNEFYCPISLPLLIDKGTTQRHPLRLLLSYYLKRGRENEFYSLWSYLSPSHSYPPPPHLKWHTPALSLSFSLLNTKIGNEFYCPCPFLLSSVPSYSYSSALLLLSLSFAALKKEKINFTAPSPP